MKKKTMLSVAVALTLFFCFGTLSAFAAETKEKDSPAQIVNINKADIDTLKTLKGIGDKIAQRIIEYRKKIGGFKNIEDLMEVKGIGEKLFEAIKPFIKV